MKNKALILLILSILLVLTSCNIGGGSGGSGGSGGEEGEITFFENGTTSYNIVTAAGAPEEAKALAKELSALSGASPEVLTDASPEAALEILVGDTNRSETAALVPKLQGAATVSAFYYMVAVEDGKLVILADNEVGYIYALDYIKNTYIKDGKMTLKESTCDMKPVVWDDYYASDLYFDRLTAEADKGRYDEEKDQLNGEMGRYDDNGQNTIMTVEQAITQYKNQVAAFDTALFGEYTSVTFTSANTYREPTLYPEKGAHPRILFTANTINEVRANLEAPENAKAYKRYIALSDAPCDGKFKTVTGNMTHNYDSSITAKIEAKAFRYAMTGDKIYGYEAILAAKNAMLTIDVPHTVGDWCRTYGHLMYVVACVYDWCYDLLTEEDKTQFVNGGVNLLGMHLECVCYVSSTNKVPIAQGTIYGHGAEDQLLVDYLSFAIAVFDEAPEIYELVGGRILNDYTEAQNYLYESGMHWEGSMYGAFRAAATIVSNLLFNKMTDGAVNPFSDKLEDMAIALTYQIRPDGQVFRIGDLNENKTQYAFESHAAVWLYASAIYGNSYVKSYAYNYLRGFDYFINSVAGLSVVQFLAVNDPEVSYDYQGEVPLTLTISSPGSGLFAKSANDDKNAFAIYMTMPENYASSHAHMECGSFQIFYKGALASDSGAYSGWGGEHHMGYNMQTISSNSLLIYNPEFTDYRNPDRINMIYSGGQSIDNGANLPETLEQLKNHPANGQCVSLGVANVEEGGKYLYSYMGGDMTGAYDEETVDEVTRYMFAVATGDEDCPLVFMTYDRITSDDASFKKTALLHVQQAPTITEDGFAIVTNTKNGNSGKMIVQSVGEATEYTVIGGEGKEFWVNDRNIDPNITLVDGSIAEYGWGRIEISPETAEKTNTMLSVMYVTDAKNNSAPVRAKDISSENLAGSMIFGKAVLFSRNEKLLTKESSFTLDEKADCYVAGVSAGQWTVKCGDTVIDTVTVAEGTNLITFTATQAGTYTITPAN